MLIAIGQIPRPIPPAFVHPVTNIRRTVGERRTVIREAFSPHIHIPRIRLHNPKRAVVSRSVGKQNRTVTQRARGSENAESNGTVSRQTIASWVAASRSVRKKRPRRGIPAVRARSPAFTLEFVSSLVRSGHGVPLIVGDNVVGICRLWDNGPCGSG
jgi:hypothetical protein